MFKTRARKVEEEAKKEKDYRPTSELKAEEEKPQYEVPWAGLGIIIALVAMIIISIILIFVFRK